LFNGLSVRPCQFTRIYLLKVPEKVLENEKQFTIFHERIAHLQRDLADLNKQVAKLERKIADRRIDLAKEKIDFAKKRLNISKSQFKFVKANKTKQAQVKIENLKNQYKSEQKELNEARNAILEIENDIRKKVNKTADLKAKTSIKLSEIEKIRYKNNI